MTLFHFKVTSVLTSLLLLVWCAMEAQSFLVPAALNVNTRSTRSRWTEIGTPSQSSSRLRVCEFQSSSPLSLSLSLTNDEISRYSRHLVLSDVGMKGQTALKNSSVIVIGAGGLGSPCLLYLAAAGIGHIGIVVSHN